MAITSLFKALQAPLLRPWTAVSQLFRGSEVVVFRVVDALASRQHRTGPCIAQATSMNHLSHVFLYIDRQSQ